MNKEPVITIAAIQATIVAVLSLLTAFGVDLTQEQQVAIVGVAGTVLPLIFAVWARSKVTPS